MFNLIIFVDSENGYDFGGKRQTKDSKVIQTLMTRISSGPVFTNSTDTKSMLMLAGLTNEIAVIDDKCEIPETSETFTLVVETGNVDAFMPFVSELTVVNWNRKYLSTRRFDINENVWQKFETVSYPGTSHDTITETTYVRR